MTWFEKLTRFVSSAGCPGISVEPEHVVKQMALTAAYDQFITMSQLQGVHGIHFANGSSVVTLDDGRNYLFDMHNPVARLYTVPYTGTFEAKETDWLRQRISTGMICIDAGGSFGWHAVLLSQLVGESGKVYSFEPLPNNFNQLKKNISMNNCCNVQLECCALAETAGMRELFLPDIGVSGSFELHEYQRQFEKILCPTVTLDQFCLQNSVIKIDFIKADVEGAEWLVLKGGEQIIKRDRPILFVEIQAHSTKLFGHEPRDVFVWLSGRGYTPYWVDQDASLRELCDPSGLLPDHNFIFIYGEGDTA